jgi:hypothetical protein
MHHAGCGIEALTMARDMKPGSKRLMAKMNGFIIEYEGDEAIHLEISIVDANQ